MSRRLFDSYVLAALLGLLSPAATAGQETPAEAAESTPAASTQAAYDAYQNGDIATALSMWRQLANGGDAEAQMNMSAVYLNGTGVDKDIVESTRWARLAAEQGNLEGQLRLARCFDEGLGLLFEDGNGVAMDLAQAMKWYRASAEQGDSEAQFKLAKGYCQGQGVAADPIESAAWLKKAADQGLEEALAWTCAAPAAQAAVEKQAQ